MAIKLNRIIIILLLFLVGALLTIIQIFTWEYSPTLISNYHSISISDSLIHRYSIPFFATEDNLGIVSLKIHTNIPIRDNSYIDFNLYEGANIKAIYSQSYLIRQFFTSEYFPFGFPPIENSKGKKYIAEIIVENPEFANNTIIDKNSKLISIYQFEKNQLINNPRFAIEFITKKFLYSLKSSEFLGSFIFNFIPLITTLCWYIFLKETVYSIIDKIEILLVKQKIFRFSARVFPRKDYILLVFSLPIGLILQIILMKSGTYQFNILFVLIGCIIWYFKLSNKVLFAYSLLFLFFLILSILFFDISSTQDISAWVVIFLAIASVKSTFYYVKR